MLGANKLHIHILPGFPLPLICSHSQKVTQPTTPQHTKKKLKKKKNKKTHPGPKKPSNTHSARFPPPPLFPTLHKRSPPPPSLQLMYICIQILALNLLHKHTLPGGPLPLICSRSREGGLPLGRVNPVSY